MPAEITIMPANERQARLDQTQSTGRTHRVPFRGESLYLQTVLVPIDLPIYRVANMRTSVLQRSFIAEQGLRADFFSSGQEDPSVQRAQHSLLTLLAKDQLAPIYEGLQNSGSQTEALVITAQGIVLNGNRRLAAMRDLLAEQPQQYRSFGHIEVAVLPEDATEDDLTATETELQIAPELKLQYGWVEEALGLRRQLEVLGWPIRRAVSSWGRPEKELRHRLDRIRWGDEYLASYLRVPADYSQLATHEQAFITLTDKQQAGVRSGKDPSHLEAERYVVYAVLSNPVEFRAYEYAQFSGEITTKLLPLLETAVPAEVVRPQPVDADDPLADLETADNDQGIRSQILAFLKEKENGEQIAQMAQEALEEVKTERRVARRGAAAAEAARRINSAANGMAIHSMDPETAPPTVAQLLAGIATAISRLREILSAHPSAAASISQETLSAGIDALKEIQGLTTKT